MLSEDNQRRSQVKLGSAADFSLDISETDLSVLTASIVSPSGRDEPCLLKRMANNHIGNVPRPPASIPLKCPPSLHFPLVVLVSFFPLVSLHLLFPVSP